MAGTVAVEDLTDLLRGLQGHLAHAAEERVRYRRALLAEREADMREFLAETVRRAYEAGRESSWRQLLETDPPLVATQPNNLLDSATPDTYLAIDASTATTSVL